MTGLGLAKVKRADWRPDRQRGRMSGAEAPMETGGDNENRTHKNSGDAADYCDGTATGKTIQVCLVPVRYDQYPKDQEADRFADQAHSSRDPLKYLSAEHPVGRFDFRL